MRSASLSNVLIRCTRTDEKAAAAGFELVRRDLGLWVLEFETDENADFSVGLSSVCGRLAGLLPELRGLADGSQDFTLHLALWANDIAAILIPPVLSEIAAQCGFGIEIVIDPGT
ncbi:MAG: hypothetical protein EOP85_23160 [Verrucomicrobiaceae bacterium]|nr:MAG: hypothetical protein EOP85_23160 [Verrucomicrobiaceae bacterium]